MKVLEKNRYTHIDVAKGILICLVVLGHILIYANNGERYLYYTLPTRYIYSFHMPAFFMISGSLFNNKKWNQKGFKSFLNSRIKTLLIPYLFFELCGIVFQTCIFKHYGFLQGIYNMLSVKCNIGANWFLIAAFLANIFLYFTLKCQYKSIQSLLVMLFFIIPFIVDGNELLFILFRGMIGYTFMYVGYCMKKWMLNPNYKFTICTFFFTVIISSMQFLSSTSVDLYACNLNHPLLVLLGGIIGGYFIVGFSRIFENKYLRYIGSNSIIIMGTHQLVLYSLGEIDTFLWILVALLIIIVVEIPVIYIINEYFPFFVGKNR